jgi:hypothetical protein
MRRVEGTKQVEAPDRRLVARAADVRGHGALKAAFGEGVTGPGRVGAGYSIT